MKRFKTLFLILTAVCLFSPALLSAQMNWTCATDSAEWSPRDGHTSVVFDNKMWVIGGWRNDAWYSTDGVNWTQATATAPWSARHLHTSVVFDNKIWVIGGLSGGFGDNDVWYSTDGINWTQATSSAGWSARYGHTSVVFDNKMWVIGGWDITNYFNDVWYSTDGANWTQATASAQWSARFFHTSVVYDNKIWVIGGFSGGPFGDNDVWYSSDGVNWAQATASAGWSGRHCHTSVVFDNRMWVVGGGAISGLNTYGLNDVWWSTDGINWIQADSNADWIARYGHSSVVLDNRMWTIGGLFFFGVGIALNDVWYSYGLGIEERSIPNTESIMRNATVVRNALILTPSTIDKPQVVSQLLDISGRKVMDLHSGANNIRHLAPGVYFITRNNNNQVTKIIVTR